MGTWWKDDFQTARDLGEKKVVLETSCHQAAAMKFYVKTGWTEVYQDQLLEIMIEYDNL